MFVFVGNLTYLNVIKEKIHSYLKQNMQMTKHRRVFEFLMVHVEFRAEKVILL